MSTVELQEISKTYGAMRAVDGIHLAVGSGEFVTLLGPSGCGKSTTLQIIAGFVYPTTGRVQIGGRDCTHLAPHKRNVGMVFQNYALFPHMTIFGNVEFGLRMRKVAKAERARRVDEALAMVQLDHLAEQYPGRLSGGQQQRVALARALVIQPDLLLLDEPFGALDKQLRDRMRLDLRELQQRLGISMVFVTHDQDEALSMSDRIAVMSEGRIRQIGTPAEIYEQPANRFVAEFMGESNILSARVLSSDGGRTITEAAGIPLAIRGSHVPGTTITLMIRPEKIGLRPAAPDDAGLRGKVVDLQYFGASVHYQVAVVNGTRLAVIHHDAGPANRIPEGGDVTLNIPETLPFVVAP